MIHEVAWPGSTDHHEEIGGDRGLARSMRGWLQPALADLVQQRLVADLEDARGLGAIPPHVLEHFLKGFALGFSSAAPRDLPQALGDQRPRRRGVHVPTPRYQGLDRL